MPESQDSAVLVLPPGCLGAALDSPLGNWLCRGNARRETLVREPLDRVVASLGLPAPDGAHGALRFWGQTGERPSVWLAAADPVFLEPRLDHLRLHHLDPADARADTAALFDELEDRLAADDSLGFIQLDGRGYVRAGSEGFATAGCSPATLDGEEPSRHMPSPGGRFHSLSSEIEMALFQSPVQARRESAGRRPISGLWLWGGGRAPAVTRRPLPTLFADDPLAHGYWHSAAARATRWPGRLRDCLEADGGMVGFLPWSAAADPVLETLEEARRLVAGGDLRRVTLLFAESLSVVLTRAQRLRFWRRPDALPLPDGVLP